MPGWTLTVDLPISEGLDRLCTSLDELVVGAGGRCYLLGDRLGPETLRQMYPRLDDFLAVRHRVDPDSMFTRTWLVASAFDPPAADRPPTPPQNLIPPL